MGFYIGKGERAVSVTEGGFGFDFWCEGREEGRVSVTREGVVCNSL